MKNKTRIIFRADGNSQIGLGHVIRSLALAEMLSAEFDCVFAIQEPATFLREQILKTCGSIITLASTINSEGLLEEAAGISENLTGNDILVLDGYNFSAAYQQTLRQKGSLVICLDDLHDREFVADAIINIAGGVQPTYYKAAPYTRLYLGPEFALLRKPFRDAQTNPNLPNESRNLRILVCFGGADPENFTLTFVKKISDSHPEIPLEIVTGSAYLKAGELKNLVDTSPGITWHQNLAAREMADLMAKCPVAICSASSVAYEYGAINGLLFLVKTAENQNDIYNFLIEKRLAFPAEKFDPYLQNSNFESLLAEIENNQKTIFNGQAAKNLKAIFAEFELQAALNFRLVKESDATLIFEWANDPVVRKHSFNSEPIPFETHLAWFRKKLADPNALMLLALVHDQPAALLRFDITGETALISYQISAGFRGKGLGHRVLQLGRLELIKYFPAIKEAIGYVQPDNFASIRAFEKAEFLIQKSSGKEEINLKFSYHF